MRYNYVLFLYGEGMDDICDDGCWGKAQQWIRGRLVWASGADIRSIRNGHGLTQSYCADMCYVSHRTWQKYEREGAPLWVRELFVLKLMVR